MRITLLARNKIIISAENLSDEIFLEHLSQRIPNFKFHKVLGTKFHKVYGTNNYPIELEISFEERNPT